MAKPDILPGYSITELFPQNFGALAHRLSRDRTPTLLSERATSTPIEPQFDSHEVKLEDQPVISGDLIEATPVDPGQMIADLREASSSFVSMDPM